MLNVKYNHKDVEANKNDFWHKNDLFKADPNSKKDAFTIVIPPPNVTGKLHLGHAWDTTIQDILIRYKKMNGFETLWLPGMDHAAIATEAKVVARIKDELGISKYDLTRDEFLKHAWNWKEEYASTIRSQWNKLGLSLDYSKERFTLDEGLNKSVNRTFKHFYDKGLIYKGKKIINWDPKLQTALSNIEVEYEDRVGKFYHLKYFFENGVDFLEVATTRPETCFADAAVAVNPKDENLAKFIGSYVINPTNGEKLEVIGDSYVEIGFGTGALKVTPAHDPNDFLIGKRHNLEVKVCMNLDGTMNETTGEFNTLDRDVARTKLMEKLDQEGKVVKIVDHQQNVGKSQRSGVVVEPMLSEQWFVKMDHFVDLVRDMEAKGEAVNIVPARFKKNFDFWLDNMEDWCISRQIWWGHQIPAWYHNETGEIFVGENEPEDVQNWTRDEDTLDTWFSSGLWPFSTLNWDEDENSALMEKFYPNSVLVTGHDILFFWVARMIFMSAEMTGKMPFKDVILHGLIRDEQNRKMSKSLGNGVDPMDVIEEHGADALRYFLTTNVEPGQDLRYEIEKVKSSANFINKIWNSTQFVLMNLNGFKIDDVNIDVNLDFEEKWILSRFNQMLERVNNAFTTYEFTVFGKEIYNFIKFEYCDWYIEIAKTKLQANKDDNNVKSVLLYVLDKFIKVLHPFMPFVTDEIYKEINGKEISVFNDNWPVFDQNFVNKDIEKKFAYFENVTTQIRNIRLEQKIGNKKTLEIKLDASVFEESTLKVFLKLNNLEVVNEIANPTQNSYLDFTYELNLDGLIDNTEIIAKFEKEIAKLQGGLKGLEAKLSNEKFVSNAPEEVVASETKRFNLLKSELEQKQAELVKLKG